MANLRKNIANMTLDELREEERHWVRQLDKLNHPDVSPAEQQQWRAASIALRNVRLEIRRVDPGAPVPVPAPAPPIGPLALAASRRPSNYADLPPQRQWEIDKDLGILDWDGDPSK